MAAPATLSIIIYNMICVKAPIRQVACFTKAGSGSEAHRCRPFLSKIPPSAAIRLIFLLGKEKTAAYKSILFTVIKLTKEIFMEPNENSLNVKVAALPLLQCKEQTLDRRSKQPGADPPADALRKGFLQPAREARPLERRDKGPIKSRRSSCKPHNFLL